MKELQAKIGCKMLMGRENLKNKLKRKVAGLEPIEKGIMVVVALAICWLMKDKFVEVTKKVCSIIDGGIDSLSKY